MNRFKILAGGMILSFAFIWPDFMKAAQLKDEPSTASAETSIQTRLHQLTQSAHSAKDFSQIVEQCQAALLGDCTEADKKYLRTLQAWALNRRCEKRAELAADFLAAGNRSQANLISDEALADAIAAIDLDPTRWRAFLNRGIFLADSGMLNEALADFRTVCKLQPQETLGWFNCGEMLSALGDFRSALECYDKALEIDSGDLQALTGRGLAKCRLGEWADAAKDFDIVVRMRANDAAALTNRGDARQGLAQWRDAYEDYIQAAKIVDDGIPSARAAWLLATCPDEEFYRPDTALDLAQHSIEKAGETVANLEALAAALASKGNFDKAIAAQKRAMELSANPNSDGAERLKLYEAHRPFVQAASKPKGELRTSTAVGADAPRDQ